MTLLGFLRTEGEVAVVSPRIWFISAPSIRCCGRETAAQEVSTVDECELFMLNVFMN